MREAFTQSGLQGQSMLKLLSFLLLITSFNISFANTDTLKNFYQLKLEVEKLKFIQTQYKFNQPLAKIQALENQLNQLEAKLKRFDDQIIHSKELIVRQDTRIDNFNFWGNFWAMAVTILLVLGSIVGYLFSSHRANQQIKKWIDEKGEKELKPILDSKINELAEKGKEVLLAIQTEAGALQIKHTKIIDEAQDLTKQLPIKNKANLKQKAKQIQNNLIDSYSFYDLFTLHLNTYHQSEFKQSLNYINQALEITTVNKQVAKALVNKGIILEQLNKLNEAIESYDLVIKQFKDSKEVALLESVAKALVNKGITLRQLNKLNEAIESYDLAIKKFKDSKEVVLLEQVARALVNKGFTLVQLNKPQKAIESYDLVIKQFKDPKEVALLEPVANALVNKGIALVQLNKPQKAIESYDLVIKQFKDSKEVALLEPVAKALVNKIEFFIISNRPIKALLTQTYDLFKTNKTTLAQARMLEIIEQAQYENQDEAVANWLTDDDNSLINFRLDELKEWSNTLETEAKTRIKDYIKQFEQRIK